MKGHLRLILPGRDRLERAHHAALDYSRVAGFIKELRASDTAAARALEFTILTACRSGEVRFARWEEFDLDAKIWTIPANRMKAGREHRVPLSDRALTIVSELAQHRHNDFVFAGRLVGKPIGRTMLRLCAASGVTVHGFRSAFRDWAGNCTDFPREVCEAALAHTVGNATEAAYRRGDALEKRRDLMDEWASYIEPAPTAGSTKLRGVA